MPRRRRASTESPKSEGKATKLEARAELALAKANLALAKAEKRKSLGGLIKIVLFAIGFIFVALKLGGAGFDIGGLIEKIKGLLSGGI